MRFVSIIGLTGLLSLCLQAAPSEALNPAATPAGSRSVVISWGMTAGDTGDVVIEKLDGGNWTAVATVPVADRAYYDRGLSSSESYEYRMLRQDATGSSAWSGSVSASTTAQMNLIFFFADDMGYKDIVALRDPEIDGPTLYETPALDQIIENSRVFNNAYCSGPRCAVARRSILTGQYDWRPEVVGNANDYLDPVTGLKTAGGIPGDSDTYASPAQAAGYRTCYIGKYHMGASDDVPQGGASLRGPINQGFDVEIAAGHEGAPPVSYFALADPADPTNFTYGLHGSIINDASYMLPSEAAVTASGEYLTDRLTKKAKGFIHDTITNHSKPFFLTLAHYAVHTPAEAKASDITYFTTKKAGMSFANHPKSASPLERDSSSAVRMIQDNRVYAGMMKSYDDSLQELRDYLAATADPLNPGKMLSETTVIVISSDHGGKSSSAFGSGNTPSKSQEDDATDPVSYNGSSNAYSNYPTANYPYRLGKTWVYEGGLKIPLIVYYPGLTDGGGETDAFVHGADFASSFSDITGATPSTGFVDSKSFMLPVAKQENAARHEQFHFFTNASTGTGNPAIACYRKGDYKLLYFMVQRRVELYHLASDPYEKNDLSKIRPDIAEEMLQAVYTQHLSTGAKMPKPGSNSWRSEQEVLVSNGVTTLPSPPDAAPSGLSVTQISEKALQLDWTVNATNATHAVIYRSGVDERNFNGGSDTYREVAYVPISQTSWIDTSFISTVGEKYKYRVEVENLAGWNGSTVDASGEFSTLNTVNGTTNTGNTTHTLSSGTPRPIIANTDQVTVIPDETRVFKPTLNDEGEGTLTITSLTQPNLGTVVTDGVYIYYDTPAGFGGAETFTYTIQDSAAQTATGTVNLILPIALQTSSMGEKWHFDEVTGTQLEGTFATSGDSWTGVTSAQVATNGNGQLILSQDTKNHSRTSDNVVVTPKTTGRVTLEFLVNSLDLSGGSNSGAMVAFGFRDVTNNTDYGTLRLKETGGNLILEARTAGNTTLYDFSNGGVSVQQIANILIRATLDLDTGMIESEMSIGGAAVVTLPSVAVDPAATGGFSAFKFIGNTLNTNWGASDSAEIEYFSYDFDTETLSVYDFWSSTIPWSGHLDTGQSDDPDGDGYVNLMEFALGLDPLVKDYGSIFSYTHNPEIQLNFTPVRDTSVIDYRILFSTDLLDWPTEHLVTTPAGVNVQPTMPNSDKVFNRLKVNLK